MYRERFFSFSHLSLEKEEDRDGPSIFVFFLYLVLSAFTLGRERERVFPPSVCLAKVIGCTRKLRG